MKTFGCPNRPPPSQYTLRSCMKATGCCLSSSIAASGLGWALISTPRKRGSSTIEFLGRCLLLQMVARLGACGSGIPSLEGTGAWHEWSTSRVFSGEENNLFPITVLHSLWRSCIHIVFPHISVPPLVLVSRLYKMLRLDLDSSSTDWRFFDEGGAHIIFRYAGVDPQLVYDTYALSGLYLFVDGKSVTNQQDGSSPPD